MVVRVTPTPAAPKKAIGNSGKLGTTMPRTSPLLAPRRSKPLPNFFSMEYVISYVYSRPLNPQT